MNAASPSVRVLLVPALTLQPLSLAFSAVLIASFFKVVCVPEETLLLTRALLPPAVATCEVCATTLLTPPALALDDEPTAPVPPILAPPVLVPVELAPPVHVMYSI